MQLYDINYDINELRKLSERFAKGLTTAALPYTDMAVQNAAKKIRQMWVGYLQGSVQLPGVNNPDNVTSAMVKSIKIKDKTTDKEFVQSVYSNNIQVEQLDRGAKVVDYDMKQTHPYGKKSRVSKKGIPYLIIPFRWGTPNKNGTKRAHFNNVIPQAYYETAVKGLQISRTNELKKYFEENFKGESIERKGYDWARNGRLTEDQAWDDRSVGMVRMIDTSEKVRRSTYFTFRIISAKSPANSWIYHKDAKPALNYMSALENAVRPEIEKMIEEGLKQDEQMYRDMM